MLYDCCRNRCERFQPYTRNHEICCQQGHICSTRFACAWNGWKEEDSFFLLLLMHFHILSEFYICLLIISVERYRFSRHFIYFHFGDACVCVCGRGRGRESSGWYDDVFQIISRVLSLSVLHVYWRKLIFPSSSKPKRFHSRLGEINLRSSLGLAINYLALLEIASFACWLNYSASSNENLTKKRSVTTTATTSIRATIQPHHDPTREMQRLKNSIGHPKQTEMKKVHKNTYRMKE